MSYTQIRKLGLPYMGSKRKLSKTLVDFMLQENPNAIYFYDCFGGGGAMSFEAIQRQQVSKVYYNEFNTGVVELLRKIRKDGVTDEFYQWVDRETFKKHKDGDTWFSGLVATCWSFGNNQKSYLFGKEIEEDKRLLHKVVVNRCEKSLKEFNDKFELNIKMNVGMFDENMTQRRIRILNTVDIKQLALLEQLPRLQNLERLQNLHNLHNLQQLEISNLSYEQVEITTPPEETIIYLDPPYQDTEKYSKTICHKEFYEWVDDLTKKGYKVYISSYNSHLPCVLEIEHTSLLSSINTNKVTEKLFTNKEQKNKEQSAKKPIQGVLF